MICYGFILKKRKKPYCNFNLFFIYYNMILIENELTFVSIPKCASVSVHNALEKSNLKIEPTFDQDFAVNSHNDTSFGKLIPPDIIDNSFKMINQNKRVKIHMHLTISEIYTYLNSKVDTITIKRDYCKRFISSFYYIFDWWIKKVYNLNFKPSEITNDYIYKYFNDDVIAIIKQMVAYQKTNLYDKEIKKFLIEPLIKNYTTNHNKNEIIDTKLYDDTYINFRIFDSQEAWKSGYEPTFEYDINELDKLEDLFNNRFNEKIKIGKENSLNKKFSEINIVEDQKLRDWVWNKFEKPFFNKKIF